MKVLFAVLLMTGVSWGQTRSDESIKQRVRSCEKREWPVGDPVCHGYALSMAHDYYQEHPELYEAAQKPQDSARSATISLTKVFMQLSNVEMEVFKADIEASRAEASVAETEDALANCWIITGIAVLLLGVVSLMVVVWMTRKRFRGFVP